MASTYSLNNGIELIGDGEQSGTWGDTTNTNWNLIDESLEGQLSKTLASAGSSGSPNTLVISDGATSEGRHRYIDFVDGADLGATAYVRLDPNDAEKIFYVRNSLTNGRSLILFQGTYNAANDYVLANGATAVVKFDGGGAGATCTGIGRFPTDAEADELTVYAATPLTQTELAELQNIGATTISATQWGYLGGLTGAPPASDALVPADIGVTVQAYIDDLSNIGATTISSAQWGYLGGAGAYAGTLLGTTTEANFKQTVNLEIGTDVQAYSADLATYVANPLAATELAELQNIGATTISATQWGYLGGLASAPYESGDNVSFGTISATGVVDIAGSLAHTGDIDNSLTFTTDAQVYRTGGTNRFDINDSGVRLGNTGARVTAILDQDTMSSNSATALATQQSIKAYADASAGAMVFIESQDASNTATLDFTGFDATKYDAYKFVGQGLVPILETIGNGLRSRTSTNGGSTYDSTTGDYTYAGRWMPSTGTRFDIQGENVSAINILGQNDVGSDPGEDGVDFVMHVTNAGVAKQTRAVWEANYTNSSGYMCFVAAGGARKSSADVDAIQFYFSLDNIASGTITMYGLRNS